MLAAVVLLGGQSVHAGGFHWLDFGSQQTSWSELGAWFDPLGHLTAANTKLSPSDKFIGWIGRAAQIAQDAKNDLVQRLADAPQHIVALSKQSADASQDGSQYSAPPFVMPGKVYSFIPEFTGFAQIGQTLTWEAPCFKTSQVTTSMSTDGKTLSLQFDLTNRASGLCMDSYLVADLQNFKLEFFDLLHEGHVTVDWDVSKYSTEQLHDLQLHGVRIFRFINPNPLSIVGAIIDTADLFLPALLNQAVPEKTQVLNAQFLKEYVNFDIDKRSTTNVTLPSGYIQSGDFLGILRLDGLDPMLAWGMGDHTGHFTVAMEMNGTMHVCESQAQSKYWPIKNGIQCNPLDHWLQMADAASYNVIHVALSDEKRAQFNLTKAQQHVAESVGLNYGYANLLFGWVDTEFGNFPYPLSPAFYQILINAVASVDAEVGALIWARPLSARLGNVGADSTPFTIPEVWTTMMAKGIDFTALITMPEQDDWVYPDQRLDSSGKATLPGKSMVCDVFVCSVYKAAGLFGPFADEIQCTEMTNYDVYELAFFEDNASKLPSSCQQADPSLPYCQIMGDYRITLPGFNSRDPYPGFANSCSRGNPPNWAKPAKC